jgi:endonuclease/exonuclease/phosphatase family metal-dependent hydrolase
MTVIIATWNLENLYRPGGQYGPRDQASYKAKLASLAATITELDPAVLGVQEVGDPDALEDLVGELGGTWHTALSQHADSRGIRVGFLSRKPLATLTDTETFPEELKPVQADDEADPTQKMGRGALAVRVKPTRGRQLDLVVCHLKSKLLMGFIGPWERLRSVAASG